MTFYEKKIAEPVGRATLRLAGFADGSVNSVGPPAKRKEESA